MKEAELADPFLAPDFPGATVTQIIGRFGGEECPDCRMWRRASVEAREFHRRRKSRGGYK